MKTKQHPLTGIWYVAVQETRVAGKWQREYEFASGEWLIGFTPEGNYLETFHSDEKSTIRTWTADDATGIVSIVADPPECSPMKCVFGAGGYLYYYDDLPYMPQNPYAIIEHHAHTRLKLMKIEEEERL